MPPGIETRGCQPSRLEALRACGAGEKGRRAILFGAHRVGWSKDLEADRRFLSELLGIESVVRGRLIFALARSEAAVHRAEENLGRKSSFLRDELNNEIAQLRAKGIKPAVVEEARRGSTRKIGLPGRGRVGLDQPKHPCPIGPILSDAWSGAHPAV